VKVCFCCVRFGFSIPSQDIGLGNVSKIFCVEWDVKALLVTHGASRMCHTSDIEKSANWYLYDATMQQLHVLWSANSYLASFSVAA